MAAIGANAGSTSSTSLIEFPRPTRAANESLGGVVSTEIFAALICAIACLNLMLVGLLAGRLH
jgi:hypothetical protein